MPSHRLVALNSLRSCLCPLCETFACQSMPMSIHDHHHDVLPPRHDYHRSNTRPSKQTYHHRGMPQSSNHTWTSEVRIEAPNRNQTCTRMTLGFWIALCSTYLVSATMPPLHFTKTKDHHQQHIATSKNTLHHHPQQKHHQRQHDVAQQRNSCQETNATLTTINTNNHIDTTPPAKRQHATSQNKP